MTLIKIGYPAHELEHCFFIKKQFRYSDRITTGALPKDPVTFAIN